MSLVSAKQNVLSALKTKLKKQKEDLARAESLIRDAAVSAGLNEIRHLKQKHSELSRLIGLTERSIKELEENGHRVT